MGKLEKDVERWEERTHVYVDFHDAGYVSLEGDFYDDELSSIASICRKMRKQATAKPQSEQLALLDTESEDA